jgi:hypothetical protein
MLLGAVCIDKPQSAQINYRPGVRGKVSLFERLKLGNDGNAFSRQKARQVEQTPKARREGVGWWWGEVEEGQESGQVRQVRGDPYPLAVMGTAASERGSFDSRVAFARAGFGFAVVVVRDPGG